MDREEQLKQIKRSFRLLMNGVTAQSMRDKGLEYHINWGANLLHLKEMSTEYEQDYQLAVMLWKEDVRECKILATMLMPPSEMPSDLAILWLEQLRSQEIAELLCMNLLQYVSYASDLAFQLLAEESDLLRLCGFNIIARLFMRGMEPNERDINEFVDQALSALNDKSLPLRHSALVAFRRFAELGELYHKLTVNALRPLGMDCLV